MYDVQRWDFRKPNLVNITPVTDLSSALMSVNSGNGFDQLLES